LILKLKSVISKHMNDTYEGILELHNLPKQVTIQIEGVRQSPEDTGEYCARILEELRTIGHHFDIDDVARTLRSLFDGLVDDTVICKRILEDEPHPA
jgi:hypothetical protein